MGRIYLINYNIHELQPFVGLDNVVTVCKFFVCRLSVSNHEDYNFSWLRQLYYTTKRPVSFYALYKGLDTHDFFQGLFTVSIGVKLQHQANNYVLDQLFALESPHSQKTIRIRLQ